ncbi:DNA methyltransferase [Candidatus Endomicrobiellum trichonymphae]|uniref:DNA methyltransferase n=1 Tax=Endomicrobium trichonymphae TaxID=1408204 RepID=UPI0039B984A9
MFISIDDNEVHNLRLLMNEIFGEENFIANLIWESKYDAKYISYQHENILFFCKNKEEFSIGKLDRTDELQKQR